MDEENRNCQLMPILTLENCVPSAVDPVAREQKWFLDMQLDMWLKEKSIPKHTGHIFLRHVSKTGINCGLQI